MLSGQCFIILLYTYLHNVCLFVCPHLWVAVGPETGAIGPEIEAVGSHTNQDYASSQIFTDQPELEPGTSHFQIQISSAMRKPHDWEIYHPWHVPKQSTSVMWSSFSLSSTLLDVVPWKGWEELLFIVINTIGCSATKRDEKSSSLSSSTPLDVVT